MKLEKKVHSDIQNCLEMRLWRYMPKINGFKICTITYERCEYQRRSEGHGVMCYYEENMVDRKYSKGLR